MFPNYSEREIIVMIWPAMVLALAGVVRKVTSNPSGGKIPPGGIRWWWWWWWSTPTVIVSLSMPITAVRAIRPRGGV